jgi:hypothetical protein
LLLYYKKRLPIYPNGLVNYWPIDNGDMRDYIGQADMIPMINVSHVSDRLNVTQAALYLNSGYCTLPPGVYFNSTFTITIWFYSKDQAFDGQRVIDCGNGRYINNIGFAYYLNLQNKSYAFITSGDLGNKNQTSFVISSIPTGLYQWVHLAFVFDGSFMFIYVNGVNAGVKPSIYQPDDVIRNKCYIGRSNWYPGDINANAYFDDLKIYNRPLSPQEILANMNEIF